jgi:type IV fimbrial biogenesis protein FimT
MRFKKEMTQLQLGQSLIETLFVLMVIALMCGIAASSMRSMHTNIQIQTAAQDMLNDVLTARTEALRREKRITLCVAALVSSPSSVSIEENVSGLPRQCAVALSHSGNALPTWQQGWMMFVDDNNNGILDEGEVLLQRHPSLPMLVSATGNATVNRYISFGANGRSLALNGGFQAGTLTFCERLKNSNEGWLLIINAIGRPRLEKTQMTNCI